MSKITADAALQKLLTDMYATPDDYSEQHDEESIHAYRQAVNDIAFLTFPVYIWMKITGQSGNVGHLLK